MVRMVTGLLVKCSVCFQPQFVIIDLNCIKSLFHVIAWLSLLPPFVRARPSELQERIQASMPKSVPNGCQGSLNPIPHHVSFRFTMFMPSVPSHHHQLNVPADVCPGKEEDPYFENCEYVDEEEGYDEEQQAEEDKEDRGDAGDYDDDGDDDDYDDDDGDDDDDYDDHRGHDCGGGSGRPDDDGNLHYRRW